MKYYLIISFGFNRRQLVQEFDNKKEALKKLRGVPKTLHVKLIEGVEING